MMFRSLKSSLLVPILFGACALAPESDPVADEAAVRGDAVAAPAVASREPAPQGVPSAEEQSAQELFRAIWRSAAFQQELAESHLRASEFEPPLTLRQAEQRREVLELITRGAEQDAEARLRQLQDGKTAEFDYLLGTLYLRRGDFERAAQEFRKAVTEHRAYRNAWKNLALCELRLSRYQEAVAAFVEVIRRGGGEPSVYGFLGICHAQLGDFVAAESAFRMVLMMEPSETRWRMLLAQSLLRQQRYGETASLCEVMLEQDPEASDLWLLQAQAYVGLGENAKASENLEIVDRLGKSTYDSLTLLGNIYFNEELFDLATDAYLRALPLDRRGDHHPAIEIANRLASRSAFDQSSRLVKGIEQAYAQSLDDSSRLELKELRARLAAAAGATEEQVALLQEIAREDPLDGGALIQLARHWQQQGDVERALLRFEQAARIPQFARQAKVLAAQLLVNQGRFAEAKPLLQQAQQLERRDDVQKLLDYVERASRRNNG